MISSEKIKTKYMLYEGEVSPSEKIETNIVLWCFMDEMDKTMSSADAAIDENDKDRRVTKIKNFFLNLVGNEKENVEQYDMDSEVVGKISKLAQCYKGYFDRMLAVVDSNNFADIYKLAMFTYDNFNENYHYLESIRDGIQMSTAGVSYCSADEDSQEEFACFFEDVFPISKGSNKVYKKKGEN